MLFQRAKMASPLTSSVSAFQVGSYFVGQYYQVLQQQPDFAHQFYTDASTVVRVDGDSSETASTMLDIHTLIMSLNFTGIEIKTINSLESWSGGVLVVVSGSVKIKDFSGRRKFVQTFLLAPQEKGYYVMNDIFHLVDEEEINQHPAPVISEDKLDTHLSTSTPLLDPPASDYTLEVEARDYVNSIHIEGDDPDDEYSIQEQQQQEPEVETVVEETPPEELPVFHQDAVNTMQDPLPAVEEPVGEPPKLTYASILRAPKKQHVPSVAAQQAFTMSTAPDSEWHYPPQPAAQQSNSEWSFVPESSAEVAEEGLSQEGESKSVYVRNLPSSVTAADIELEFKNFGRIKPDGVFVRNRTEVGVCYAFVEFEDVQSVQNAIKASPIQLAGRQVYIEERRANSSSTSRGGGRRGRGRGSYQSEGIKGRSGGRNLGRGRNQDSGDYYRPRGNGFRGS